MSDNDEASATKQAALEALIAADTDTVECKQAAIQLLRTKVYELFSQEPIFDLPVLDYVENRLKTTLCGDRLADIRNISNTFVSSEDSDGDIRALRQGTLSLAQHQLLVSAMVKNYSDYFEAVWTKINLTWVRQLSHNSDIDVKLASLESKAAQHKTFQQQAAGAIFGPNNANRQLTVVEKALRSLEDRAGQEFLNIKAIIQNEAALAKKQLLNVQMAFNNTLESYNVPSIRAEGAATTELLRATERR